MDIKKEIEKEEAELLKLRGQMQELDTHIQTAQMKRQELINEFMMKSGLVNGLKELEKKETEK